MNVQSVLPRDAISSIDHSSFAPPYIVGGAKTGVSIHFELRDFPRDPELIEAAGPVHAEDVPGIPDALLEQAVDFHTSD